MNSYGSFGCELNQLDVEALFRRYEQIGFLYPEKRNRLAPFLSDIQENWRRMLAAGSELIRVVTLDDKSNSSFGSITDWRSTHFGWCAQHLVSSGNPMASRAVMLAEQSAAIRDPTHLASCNWFRPDNRMPKRMFGSIVGSLGEKRASVDTFDLLEVNPQLRAPWKSRVAIQAYSSNHRDDLLSLALSTRGPVYCRAEELDGEDFQLEELDRKYRDVGLRRYRRAWIATDQESGRIVGAVIVYRGPLGINFSFLENRTDLLVAKDLETELRSEVVQQLIRPASHEYLDFTPRKIPVVADADTSNQLQKSGHRLVRKYSRSVWLKAGYQGWYDHVDGFYQRILKHLERRAELSAKSECEVPQ